MKNFNNKCKTFRHYKLFAMIQRIYHDWAKKQAVRINKLCERILEEINFINSFDYQNILNTYDDEITCNNSKSNFYYELQKSLKTQLLDIFDDRFKIIHDRFKDIEVYIYDKDTLNHDFMLIHNLYKEYVKTYKNLYEEIENY